MRGTLFLMAALLMLALAFGGPAARAESGPPKLFVDGREVACDVAPYVRNGATLVPVRFVAQALGMFVYWEPRTQGVLLVHDDGRNRKAEIALWVGSPWALVDNRPFYLAAPPELEQERVMVPLRFVGEALGCEVGWDPEAWAVRINRPQPARDGPEAGSPGALPGVRSGPGK